MEYFRYTDKIQNTSYLPLEEKKKKRKSKHQFYCFYCGWKLGFRLKGKDKQHSVFCLNMFVLWLITGEAFHPRKTKQRTRPNKPKGETRFSLCDVKDTNHVKLRANKETALSFYRPKISHAYPIF